MVTTIQLKPQTRERLSALKSTPRETYDDLLNRLLNLVPEGDEEGIYTHAFRVELLQAHLEVRRGQLLGHEDVKRRLGL